MKNLSKSMFYAVIIAVIALSLFMIIAFFLPYTSATADYRRILENFSQGTYMESANMINGNATDISLLDFAKIYSSAETLGRSAAFGNVYVIIIALIGLFSLGTLIFASLRKPIGILIFDALTFIVFIFLSWDFKDRGLVQNQYYNFGMSYYIYYICTSIIFIGAVVMLVMKIQQKKHKMADT